MKPSHTSTPRQMRDGSWTFGSVSADPETRHRFCDLLVAILAVAALALISIGVI